MDDGTEMTDFGVEMTTTSRDELFTRDGDKNGNKPRVVITEELEKPKPGPSLRQCL